MLIYATIDTENNTVSVEEDTSDYCAVWYNVKMSIQEIIQDVEEEILKNT